jgi:DNA replication and repair protein RecF
MDARTFASQGQIRGIVIALKVAQLELTRAYRTWSPLLLLDDIISELDDHRVKALVNYLSNYPGQLFVTTAEVSKVKALHSQFSGFKVIDLGQKSSPNFEQNHLETGTHLLM